MSCKPEDVVFTNMDQIALYTTKTIKRLVRLTANGIPTNMERQLQHLVEVLELNLNRLKVDKNLYFGAIRDYSRVFRYEWTMLEMEYNNLLIVVGLRLGLEKIWSPHGCYPFTESEVSDAAAHLYPKRCPAFVLKHLDQSEPLFDYFAKHSPKLQELYMPLSDNHSFIKCTKFKNLCVIELAGGVSDKVICNALWNIGSKKSDKLLDLALTKDPKYWQLTLPHLEVLRNNILKNEAQRNAMRITLGAAALAIQPKMKAVESLMSWGTFEAILHLLDMEAKHKQIGENNQRILQVTCLTVKYERGMNMANVDRVAKACPKLSHLRLNRTKDIHPDISLLDRVLPMRELKMLTLDASYLTDLEFTVILASMKCLEHLTLRMRPQSIFKYNLPKPPYKLSEMSEEDYRLMSMFPPIKTLVIEFLPENKDSEKFELPGIHTFAEGSTKTIIEFIAAFATVEEIHFRNTILIHPTFLVLGCFGGAITVLKKLCHISIMSCHEDIPRPSSAPIPPNQRHVAYIPNMSHFVEVQKLLPELQEDAPTFNFLERLKSIEIDEFYLSPQFDSVIKALRLSGVHVSVMYRKGIRFP